MTTFDVPRVGPVTVLIDERELPAAGLQLRYFSHAWYADGSDVAGDDLMLVTAFLRARGITNC
ncbi:hypothetical protein [Microbacterium enclense]|nr:hypothetical protein [Microbacterium enclense]KSU54825.1 hypothetical protein AS029_07715 [Microbacterium enclense]